MRGRVTRLITIYGYVAGKGASVEGGRGSGESALEPSETRAASGEEISPLSLPLSPSLSPSLSPLSPSPSEDAHWVMER